MKNKSNNNNLKQKKNALNNKEKDKSKAINNKYNNNNVIENENNNKVEKIEINIINDIKLINYIPEKLLEINNNAHINLKESKPNIKEENSPNMDISPEISKK